jgi:hypothetical protein
LGAVKIFDPEWMSVKWQIIKENGMPDSLKRLRKLAGVGEREVTKEDDKNYDAEIEEFEAQERREVAVKQTIVATFKQLGLTVIKVEYDEHPERSATVILDDEPLGWSLKKLAQLYNTNLSDEYKVGVYDVNIEVYFRVRDDVK